MLVFFVLSLLALLTMVLVGFNVFRCWKPRPGTYLASKSPGQRVGLTVLWASVGMSTGLGAVLMGLNAFSVPNYSPAFASFILTAVLLLFCLTLVGLFLNLGILQMMWFSLKYWWMDPLGRRLQRIVQRIRPISGHTRNGH